MLDRAIMSRSFRTPVARLAFMGAVAACGSAWASAPGDFDNDSNYVSYDPGPTLRRGGFALGLETGVGVAHYAGYPNEVSKLDDPTFRQSTGAGLGTELGLWLGGALRDWLTVGLGASLASVQGNGTVGSGFGLLFNVEAFPLFNRGKALRDLGLGFSGGVAFGVLFDENDTTFTDPVANGGVMSRLSGTVFYEAFRFWHFSSGPRISYTHAFSQSLSIHQVVGGWRMAFYGVQPKNSERTSKQAAESGQAGYSY